MPDDVTTLPPGCHAVFPDPSPDGSLEWATYERGELRRLALTPESAVARVGSVEVQLRYGGGGKVLVDGQPVKCRRVAIVAEVGKAPQVFLDVVAVEAGARGPGRG